MNSFLSWFLAFEAEYPNFALLTTLAAKTSGMVLMSLAISLSLKFRSAAARSWIWRCALAGAFFVLLFSFGPPVLTKARLSIPVEETESPKPAQAKDDQSLGDGAGRTQAAKNVLPSAVFPPSQATAPISSPAGFPWQDWWRKFDSFLPALIWTTAKILILLSIARIGLGAIWLRKGSRDADAPLLAAAEEAGRDLGRKGLVKVRISDQIASPLVLGLLAPVVYLPGKASTWNASKLRAVFLHELAHWVRKDNLWQYAGQIMKAILWWNPLVAMAANHMSATAEEAADDMVLLHQDDAASYARDLVEIASAGSSARIFSPGVAMTGNSSLEKRIKALLSTNPWRGKIGRAPGAIISAAMIAFAIAASLYAVRSSAAKSSNEPAEQKTVVVQVVDAKGTPLPDVFLKPFAMRTKEPSGASYGYQPESNPFQVHKTDAQGKTDIPYPKEIQGLEIGKVTLAVYRADFVAKTAEIDTESPAPIALEGGAEVTVKIPGSGESSKSYVDFKVNDFEYHIIQWKRSADGGSLSAHLPEEAFAIRAVAFDAAGNASFSSPERVTPHGTTPIELTAHLTPGTTVSGQLAASVPRPVKNGRVVALVTTPSPGETPLDCEWSASADIAEDGTFTLPSLPEGGLGVVAICDGFVSRDPVQAAPNGSRSPQIFTVGRDPITIPMEATGVAKVLVKDPQGRPAANASVLFWPNQVFGNSSSILGRKLNSAEIIRSLQDSPEPFNFPRLSDPAEPPFSAKTDADGVAVVRNLPIGKQSFAVRAEGLEMMINNDQGYPVRFGSVEVKPGGESPATVDMEKAGTSSMSEALKKFNRDNPQMQLDSPSGSNRQSGQSFEVEPGEILSGNIVDESGKPIEGALVDVWTWYKGNETTTDNNGAFRLKLEKGEKVEVRFSKQGLSPVHVTNQEAGRLKEPIVLDNKTILVGIVTVSDGKPVAGAEIKAICGPKDNDTIEIDNIRYEARSGPDGKFRVPVHPDTYKIQARAPNGNIGNVASKIDAGTIVPVEVVIGQGATFRARLIDSITGKPIQGLHVRQYDAEENSGISNESGTVKIPGLLPGDIEFQIDGKNAGYSRWWSPQAIHEWDRFQVEPNGWQRNFDGLSFEVTREMEPVTIVMEQGVVVRGKVVDPQGQPVAKATVDPARSGSENSLSGDTRFSAVTASDGSFELLIPASQTFEYNLTAHDGAYGQWRKWANGLGARIKTTPGQLIEAGTIQLTHPVTITGRVLDAEGRPVADREVRAVPHSLDGNRYYDPTTKTRADGTFEIKFASEGSHYIQVAPFWLDPKEAPSERTTIVKIGKKNTAPIEFKISRDRE